jgi:pyrroline-5-carboxylate reductase
MGFDEATAALLVTQTFLGSTELLVASGKTPLELRKQVTSPNGTTMQAIAKLEAGNLVTLFTEATNAALARSKEIAAGK